MNAAAQVSTPFVATPPPVNIVAAQSRVDGQPLTGVQPRVDVKLLPALRRQLHEQMISLDGLDALLDRVFAFETTVLNVVQRPQVDTSEIIDFVPTKEKEDLVTIEYLRRSEQLLKAQLDYAQEQMTQYRYDIRRLELDLAAKQDQVQLMPELLLRAAKTTVAENKVAGLEATIEGLKGQLIDANRELEQHRSTWWAKFSRTFSKWLS